MRTNFFYQVFYNKNLIKYTYDHNLNDQTFMSFFYGLKFESKTNVFKNQRQHGWTLEPVSSNLFTRVYNFFKKMHLKVRVMYSPSLCVAQLIEISIFYQKIVSSNSYIPIYVLKKKYCSLIC